MLKRRLILVCRPYYLQLGWVLAGCLMVGLLTMASAQAQATQQQSSGVVVTIVDRGKQRTIITTATTVNQALTNVGINLDRADVVEPQLNSQLTQTNTITVYRARPVTIIDGLRRIRVTTAQQTPSGIAAAGGLALYREDKARLSWSDNLSLDGARLLLTIERSRTRTVTVEEDIPFAHQQTPDATRPIGNTQVQRPGQPGRKRLTYQLQLEQGAEVGRQLLSEVVIRQPQPQLETVGTKPTNPLTKSKGAHIFTDSKGVAHRETYYDLPMNVVMQACGGGGRYTVRADGAKVDKDGYILVAANYGNYPRCSVVETSMGPGKVYDTGGFAVRHPHGFDLATDWTVADGR